MQNMYGTLLTEQDNGVLIITINRTEKMNALNKEVFNDLDKMMDEVYQDVTIKTVIITGAGEKAFVAGADIAEFASFTKEEAIALSKRGQAVFMKIENSPKPVIAAVNGFALGGGCELAMACHFRICSNNARFGQPEINLGLIPGYGGTQRLTQLIGKAKSMELHMTGNMIDAQEAFRLGLVNQVTDTGSLMTTTRELATIISNKAPLALNKIITCINAATGGYELEAELFGASFETEDMKEGTAAFLEKRKAEFKGK
jgi:enoyl-CoA hydratase